MDAHDAGRDPGPPAAGKPAASPDGPLARRTRPPGAMAAAGVAAVLGIAGAFALLAMTAGNGTALEAVHGEGTDGDPAGGLDATSSLPLPSGIAPTVTPLPSDQPVATDDPLPPAIATTSTASASSPSPTSSSSSTAPAATTSTTSTSSSPTTSDGLLPLPTLPILG